MYLGISSHMGEFTPPLRKIVRRSGENEVLECGHEQKKRPNPAKRRRCAQCRRARVTISEKTEAAEGLRCPYCFDDFSDPEEETWTCPKCRTKVHGECHDENDGCVTAGCRSRAPITVRPRITPTQIPQPVARPTVEPEVEEPVEVGRSTTDRTLMDVMFMGLLGVAAVVSIIVWAAWSGKAAFLVFVIAAWVSGRITERLFRR